MINTIRRFINDLKTPHHQQINMTKNEKTDFSSLISREIILIIFSYLNNTDYARCFRVSKTWKALASHNKNFSPEVRFGKKYWEPHFKDIGKIPALPSNIYEILRSPCPFFPNKKIEETHLLVLIPKTINGLPLNLINLETLVKALKKSENIQYKYIWKKIINKYGKQENSESHWVLMTKNVIKGSENKNYKDQEKLIAKFNKATINYEIPHALDAVTCIFMHYINYDERLFASSKSKQDSTMMKCQEKIEDSHIAIGDFSNEGLVIAEESNAGVAALRRL